MRFTSGYIGIDQLTDNDLTNLLFTVNNGRLNKDIEIEGYLKGSFDIVRYRQFVFLEVAYLGSGNRRFLRVTNACQMCVRGRDWIYTPEPFKCPSYGAFYCILRYGVAVVENCFLSVLRPAGPTNLAVYCLNNQVNDDIPLIDTDSKEQEPDTVETTKDRGTFDPLNPKTWF